MMEKKPVIDQDTVHYLYSAGEYLKNSNDSIYHVTTGTFIEGIGLLCVVGCIFPLSGDLFLKVLKNKPLCL